MQIKNKKPLIITGTVIGVTGLIAAITIPLALKNNKGSSEEHRISKNDAHTTIADNKYMWPAGTQESGLFKFNDKFFTTEEKAMKAAGYSPLKRPGYAKGGKIFHNIEDITDVSTTASVEDTAPSITVDGVPYTKFTKAQGGQLKRPAWFKQQDNPAAPDATPIANIPTTLAQVGSDFYTDAATAEQKLGYVVGTTPKTGVTTITVNGKSYSYLTAENTVDYKAGTEGWTEKSTPNVLATLSFTNDEGPVVINGKSYTYHDKVAKTYDVPPGWYWSKTPDGTTDPSNFKASNEKVLMDAKTITATDFTSKFVYGSHSADKTKIMWYHVLYSDEGVPSYMPASDEDVLKAAQTEVLTSFHYLPQSIKGAEAIQAGWYDNEDGTGSPINIDDLVLKARTIQSVIKWNGKTYTYNAAGSDGAIGHVSSSDGWYSSDNTKLAEKILSTLITNDGGITFKKHSHVTQTYTAPIDGSISSLTIQGSTDSVLWVWKTNFDGAVLDNPGFFKNQPTDKTATGFDISTATFKYQENFFTTKELLIAAIINDGYKNVKAGWENDLKHQFLENSNSMIAKNQDIPAPKKDGEITIDSQVIKVVPKPSSRSMSASDNLDIIYVG